MREIISEIDCKIISIFGKLNPDINDIYRKASIIGIDIVVLRYNTQQSIVGEKISLLDEMQFDKSKTILEQSIDTKQEILSLFDNDKKLYN